MRWLAAAFILVALHAPAALAQESPGGCQAPILSMPQAPKTFAPGYSYSLAFAIENPNTPPIDSVRAQMITTAPSGWSVVPAQRELTLGPRNVSFDALTIGAPTRGGGEAAGNITIHVTFVCTTGDTLTSSSADATIPVRLETFQAPWPILLTAFSLLALLVAVLGLRRLRRGVAIVPAREEREVAPGRSVKYTFRVENRRGKPQRFTLLGVGVPEGWSLHLALDEVELEPGEDKSLWAVLKVAHEAQPGSEATITLRLESPRGAREGTSMTLVAKVTAEP